MGTSVGGIAIKTNTSNIELHKVVHDLFGAGFEKTDTHCDTRKNECVWIAKTPEFLIIVNTDFTDQFFEAKDAGKIQQYLDYFSRPNFVFAFEEYDSGGTYSYSLMYDGIVKRQFRSITYETAIDTGELEPIELKWKNAEKTTEDLGDGEFETIYKDPVSGHTISEMGLPQIILQELMMEKLGFANHNMHRFATEQIRFKRNQAAPQPIANEPTAKKPWWKIW